MKFLLTLRTTSYAMSNEQTNIISNLIYCFFEQINNFVEEQHYGDGIYIYLISLYVVNPPNGYEHLYKDFKPKYTEYKLLKNKYTGDDFEIKKQFHYSIKISGNLFEKFVIASEEESKKILASEILKSLSYLDSLPKKIKDFDKERFKADMYQFFKEQNLV